jgi:hypothetical protein
MCRPLSHRQKYRVYNATLEQLEARYQCKTCDDVIENDAALYCRSCRIYWDDCANGLFDFDDDDDATVGGE